MKKTEILALIQSGAKVKKASYTKYKRNKIVRGSFYTYTIDDNPITAKQFEDILYRLRKDNHESTPSESVYMFAI